MKKPFYKIRILKYLFLFSASLIQAACTTLIAHTSIEPYINDDAKRNNLKVLAFKYCQEKLSTPGNNLSIKMPDYQFTTDGCSRWFDENWVSCCVVHDIVYWCGGSDEDRMQADQIIMECVNRKASLMGDIMYLGVRVGGSPWLPTPWRWGYGWKEWPKAYQKTTHQNIEHILQKLHVSETIEQQFK